ncbi:hypothetical protein CTAYLR_004240 [Chrysophaeum taylorii]|uniref:STAS domain-containing protein n=1 Tax=Chrysophaeum taylorii TaxID=2483200 RepID=A0AAD7XLA3_9STRA|nr:hypothetical protein CTAYLR_004240 [Chrysophaeum taylorii]
MQFFADGALEKAGAAAQEREEAQETVEESVYMLELPTLSEESSLAAAVELRLRSSTEAVTPATKSTTTTRESLCALFSSSSSMVRSVLPPLEWVPKLSAARARADVIAGLTVGVMAVPQSMSYAAIAGLDYVYGLYAAAVPTLVYGFLGGSGQLAVGPVALVSLLVEEGLRDALTRRECPEYVDSMSNHRQLEDASSGATCPAEYARLVHLCMFFVGVLQFAGSIAKLGFLVNFLGHPVISGFTSGAAIIIGVSQMKSWLGVSLVKSQYAYETLLDLVAKVANGEARSAPLMLGLASYGALWGIRYASQKCPQRVGWLRPLGPLFVCVSALGLMISAPQLRDDYGVGVVGPVPRGLPPSSFGVVLRAAFSDAKRVLPTALSAALLGFMETIAIGKSLAAAHGYELSSTREMRAVGASNVVGSFFSGYPVAGSFSRSAVANATGARTPLAGLTTSVVLFATLVCLPSFARKLPQFVLASVVVSSVVNLVAIDEARRLWHVRKPDFCLWVLAFVGVLFVGVLYGLAIAVGVSLLIVLYESVRPQIIVLWKLPGTFVYRNVKQGETNGQFVDGVLVLRVGASMYFFNVAYIKDTVLDLARRYDKVVRPRAAAASDDDDDDDDRDLGRVRYVVIEMTPVQSLDSTALHMIEDLAKDLKRRRVHMCLASCDARVEDTLRRAGLQRRVGYEWFHSNVNTAVEFCVRHRAATDALRADARLLEAHRRRRLDAASDRESPPSPPPPEDNDDVEMARLSADARSADDRAASSLVRRSSPKSSSSSSLLSSASAEGKPPTTKKNYNAFGLPSFFRRQPSGGGRSDKKTDADDDDDKDPRVLMLASKHRVVSRENLSAAELLAPERRALDAMIGHEERKHHAPSPQSSDETPASLAEKRNFLASRRSVVEQSAIAASTAEVVAPIRETLAPPRVVALPDDTASDLMIFLAVDVADRPGVLRDISDVLLRELALQVRFSEAAVVGRRSISIWRCEVIHRGHDDVLAAARRAEAAVSSCLSSGRGHHPH